VLRLRTEVAATKAEVETLRMQLRAKGGTAGGGGGGGPAVGLGSITFHLRGAQLG